MFYADAHTLTLHYLIDNVERKCNFCKISKSICLYFRIDYDKDI